MPSWRREARASIAEELGGTGGPWVEWGEPLPARNPNGSPVVLSAIGHRGSPEERAGVWRALAFWLAAGEVAVVVDHNRPRRLVAAVAALVTRPWVPGWSPARRWQRLAYPTAREMQAAGLRVERLRLVAGERVQIVIARSSA